MEKTLSLVLGVLLLLSSSVYSLPRRDCPVTEGYLEKVSSSEASAIKGIEWHEDGSTALLKAAQDQNVVLVGILLDCDTDVNIYDNRTGNTALIEAAKNGN